MSDLTRFLIESIAVGSISMLLGRSRLFRSPRWWIHRHLGDFAFDLAKCPWCLSCWLALPIAWYTYLPLTVSVPLDIILTWAAMIPVAASAGGFIYLCYGHMPLVPTEAEWYSDAELLKTNNLEEMVNTK